MLQLNKLVADCLKAAEGRRLKARDIANWIFESRPEDCAEKKRRSSFITTDAELIQQLVAEIGSNRPVIQRRFPQVRTTEGRPRLYYWSEASEEAEVAAVEPRPMPAPVAGPTDRRPTSIPSWWSSSPPSSGYMSNG